MEISKWVLVPQHWIEIAVLWLAILGALAMLGRDTQRKGVIRSLMWAVTCIAAVLLVATPVVAWVPALFVGQPICPDGSAYFVQSCEANIVWSNYIKPVQGTPNGLQMCYEGDVESWSGESGRYSLFRFRSKTGGPTPVRYELKRSCEGPL